MTTLTVMTETHVDVQASYPPAPEFSTSLCRLLRLSELDNPLR